MGRSLECEPHPLSCPGFADEYTGPAAYLPCTAGHTFHPPSYVCRGVLLFCPPHFTDKELVPQGLTPAQGLGTCLCLSWDSNHDTGWQGLSHTGSPQPHADQGSHWPGSLCCEALPVL